MHEQYIWPVDTMAALVADRSEAVTFFCGGSRNHAQFIGLFDGVFVLNVDLDTLHRRLDERPEDEWAGPPPERELLVRLHKTQADVPANGIAIDAAAPLAVVVDKILVEWRRSAPEPAATHPPACPRRA